MIISTRSSVGPSLAYVRRNSPLRCALIDTYTSNKLFYKTLNGYHWNFFDIDAEEFEEITGIDWEDRLLLIEINDTKTPHAGWVDISFLYEKRGNLEMAKKYDKPLPQWELNRQIIDYVY